MTFEGETAIHRQPQLDYLIAAAKNSAASFSE
jgi:hypothetical protein